MMDIDLNDDLNKEFERLTQFNEEDFGLSESRKTTMLLHNRLTLELQQKLAEDDIDEMNYLAQLEGKDKEITQLRE